MNMVGMKVNLELNRDKAKRVPPDLHEIHEDTAGYCCPADEQHLPVPRPASHPWTPP